MREALWPGLTVETQDTDIAEFRRDQTSQVVFVIDRENALLGGFPWK